MLVCSSLPAGLDTAAIDEAVVSTVQAGGPLYHVNGDLLAELQPDLIITQGICDVCAVNVDTVEAALVYLPDLVADGVQTVTLAGTNIAGIRRDIQQVARATGQEELARQQLAEWQAGWERLTRKQPAVTPSVLLLEWPDPPFFGGALGSGDGGDCGGR